MKRFGPQNCEICLQNLFFHLKVFLKDKYGEVTGLNSSSSCGFKVTQMKPVAVSVMHLLDGIMEVEDAFRAGLSGVVFAPKCAPQWLPSKGPAK